MTTQVEIVRPRLTGRDVFVELFTSTAMIFLSSWILMLILGHLTEWDPGYWDSVLLLSGLRIVQRTDSSYRIWSRMKDK